jgi:hypothetical protein
MIFGHYGVPKGDANLSYQCGMIKFVYPGWFCNANCYQCNIGGGTPQIIRGLLAKYPQAVGVKPVQSRHKRGVLTAQEIKTEIDANRPIIAGISPSSRNPNLPASEHVALIIGYVNSGGKTYLIVNDPYPFDPLRYPNPYNRAGGWNNGDGSYCIELTAFQTNLAWGETFYDIRQ